MDGLLAMHDEVEETLERLLARRLEWLRNDALPLWAEVGVDPAGGFFERIDQTGRVVADLPRRARVVARQTYVYATAERRGWGDYAGVVDHGMAALLDCCLLDDGLSLSTYAPGGAPLRRDFDAYDQAFVLFALATLARARPDRKATLVAAGERLLGAMQARYAHEDGGFHETLPPRAPLLQNPHMHLLEACIAFAGVPDVSPLWRVQARHLVELARRRLADRQTGAIHEHFDLTWKPIVEPGGGVIEPGHQFEWAWLLWQWDDLEADDQASAMAWQLYRISSERGCAPSRQAINVLGADLAVRDAATRLWPQTERLKAALALAGRSEGPTREAGLVAATEALVSLDPYLATPVSGLWYDRLDEHGTAIADAAPASSLYHIVCALDYADRSVHHMRDLP